MSRFHSYLTSASTIISTYGAGKPLSMHIKNFFASDKKFGSRDRRLISSLCYCYFRTGHAFKNAGIEEKILSGLFLCENKSNEILRLLRPELDEKITLAVDEKLSLLNINGADIFPFGHELGDDIDERLFAYSFLSQPAVYLRIRPRKTNMVVDKLTQASVDFEMTGDDCIKLSASITVDKILSLNKDAVVQDLNSQKVLDYLDTMPASLPGEEKIHSWDCCAASGGKSILLFDKLKGNVRLTVSDIRENILFNLRKRLGQAAINVDNSFLADLSVRSGLPAGEKFSVIICDAPCSGSGTWSRTPEQLLFFEEKMLPGFAERQKRIVSNTVPHLKEKGLFFYITCSVFQKENEDVVGFITNKFPSLKLMQADYIKGYENEADTMFVAVLSQDC